MSPSLKFCNVSSNFNSNGYQVITLCMLWMLSCHGMCKITSCWDTHNSSTYFYRIWIMSTWTVCEKIPWPKFVKQDDSQDPRSYHSSRPITRLGLHDASHGCEPRSSAVTTPYMISSIIYIPRQPQGYYNQFKYISYFSKFNNCYGD